MATRRTTSERVITPHMLDTARKNLKYVTEQRKKVKEGCKAAKEKYIELEERHIKLILRECKMRKELIKSGVYSQVNNDPKVTPEVVEKGIKKAQSLQRKINNL